MIEVVAGVIFNKEFKVLVAQRPPGSHLAGYWEFPGGKLEPGETPEQALHREFEEEFHIQLQSPQFLAESIYHYESKSVRLLGFTAFFAHGELQAQAHSDYKWLQPEDLSSLNLAPADVPFLPLIANFRQSLKK